MVKPNTGAGSSASTELGDGGMRERKYKAWDKKRKHMLDITPAYIFGNTPPTIEIINGDLITGIEYTAGCDCCWRPEAYDLNEFEIIEWIGRTDIKGIDIYDGDVVDWIDGRGEVFYDEDDGCYRHSFQEKNVAGTPIDSHRPPKRMWNKVEIIGNIRENPELQ